jgi:adenine specific DNA methylase Mod
MAGVDHPPERSVLVENEAKSYGSTDSRNMLIHGDNALALEALTEEFSGRIQCVAIDPPFNTGDRFDQYDDDADHQAWVAMMRRRLVPLHRLLADDGFLLCHIDDAELHYLKVMALDPVFGRQNYWATIYVNANYEDPSRPDRDPTIGKGLEMVLIYRKTDLARPNVAGLPRLTDYVDGATLGNRRDEGGVRFKGGKKPEKLVSLLLQRFGAPDRYVLDCFLGSGTSAAVAHKMGLPWIGVEAGQHIDTHCRPRLRRVVDGTDPTGVTAEFGWTGGGGFKFYECRSDR